MTVRVGVIGTGSIGTSHARDLARAVAGSSVAAVHDVDAARAAALADELGARALPSAGALIDDDDVDAVLIASPDAVHAEQALACLAAGKPVLCEKPLSPSADDAWRVVEAEAARGQRLITVGFMRRFDPGYLGLKAELDARTVGTPLVVHNVHRNVRPYPGHTSAQAITNSVVHEIDIMRWLLKDELVSAMCLSGRPAPEVGPGVRDPQLVLFRTAGGVLIDVESFVSSQVGYRVSCEVVGTQGSLRMGDGSTIEVSQPGLAGRRLPELWLGRFGAAYRAELASWIEGVRTGMPSGATAYDGYAATVIANAAVRAGEEGAEVPVALRPPPSA